jgi:hypothetical protein|tara:strand:- start:205 stop:378 length:174 start_codon:yes stop_codon:yes gene_type:complete
MIKQLDKLFMDVINFLADLIYPDKKPAELKRLKRWQAWTLFLFLALMIWLISIQNFL